MILAVDVETSDLPKKDLPIDAPEQPWIVSAAAILFDLSGKTLQHIYLRVRADDRYVRPGAEAVHGISSREAARKGVSETVVLGAICGLASEARYVVGFSLEFDRLLIQSALLKLGKSDRLWIRPGLTFVDLMKPAAVACKIPGNFDDAGYKWPSLDAACEVILGEPAREGTHNAWDDCLRVKHLALAMQARNLIEIIV